MFGLFTHLPEQGRRLANSTMASILEHIEVQGGSFSYTTDGAEPRIEIRVGNQEYEINSSGVLDQEELNVARIETQQWDEGLEQPSAVEMEVKTLELLARQERE